MIDSSKWCVYWGWVKGEEQLSVNTRLQIEPLLAFYLYLSLSKHTLVLADLSSLTVGLVSGQSMSLEVEDCVYNI